MNKLTFLNLIEQFKNELHSGNTFFTFESGKLPILLSAPHSVDQLRENYWKKGEYETGILSRNLATNIGTHSFYKTKNLGDDANYDVLNPYKTKLAEIVKRYSISLVIDLHIMKADRESLIEIGTGNGKNLKSNTQLAILSKNFFESRLEGKSTIDEIFPATNPHTVSSYISKECSIDCLQIEINRSLIDSYESFLDFQKMFEDYILFLSKNILAKEANVV